MTYRFGRLPARQARLLATYIGVLDDEETLRAPDLRFTVATHIYDLCGLAIGASRDAAEVAAGRGLRAARAESCRTALRSSRRARLIRSYMSSSLAWAALAEELEHLRFTHRFAPAGLALTAEVPLLYW